MECLAGYSVALSVPAAATIAQQMLHARQILQRPAAAHHHAGLGIIRHTAGDLQRTVNGLGQAVERRRAAAEKRWQREKADSPEKKTPPKSTLPKGISTPTASAHDGADWMKKYIKFPETTKS